MTQMIDSPPLDVSSSNREVKGHKRVLVIRGTVAIVLVAFAFVLWIVLKGPTAPSNILSLSGRIEGDDSAVASKTSGRILKVRFREGDTVHQGDVIAVLDDEQIRAKENQASAGVAQAEAEVASAQAQIEVLKEQLLQNQLQGTQSQGDAKGRVEQAEADLTAAKADYTQQNANLQLTEFDRDAYTRLALSGAASVRQAKEAVSKADAQVAAVAATKRRVDAAQGALTLANSTLSNPAIHNAQTAAAQRQIILNGSENVRGCVETEGQSMDHRGHRHPRHVHGGSRHLDRKRRLASYRRWAWGEL